MIKKIVKGLYILFSLIITWIFSVIIVKMNPNIANGTSAIIKDDFVLGFIGGFLGLAIAVITFLYSNVEKIRDSLYKTISDNIIIDTLETRIDTIFKELKHDTIFIFFCLIISFFAILIRDIDLPVLKWSFKGVSKTEFLYSVEISVILLMLFSLFDIIGSLFKLSDASKLFRYNNKDDVS
jgi:magnesium-transporting ATPase (P-type)